MKVMKIVVAVMYALFIFFILFLMAFAIFQSNEKAIELLTGNDIIVIGLIITFIVPNAYMFYKIMKHDD